MILYTPRSGTLSIKENPILMCILRSINLIDLGILKIKVRLQKYFKSVIHIFFLLLNHHDFSDEAAKPRRPLSGTTKSTKDP